MEDGAKYLFTQGVLGVIVVALTTVVIKLYNKTERLETDKQALLEARRVADVESIKQLTTVLLDNARNMEILSSKIEIGKTQDRGDK